MAGSWTIDETRKGSVDGSLNTPSGVSRTFESDASDGSVPDLVIPDLGGSIMAMDVEFDDTDPPSSATVAVSTAAGIELINSGVLSDSWRTYPDDGPIPVAGDVTIAVTNTGNSKIATIVLYLV